MKVKQTVIIEMESVVSGMIDDAESKIASDILDSGLFPENGMFKVSVKWEGVDGTEESSGGCYER